MPAAVVLTGLIVVLAAALHAPALLVLLAVVVGWMWCQRPRFARGGAVDGWERSTDARAASDWSSAVGRRPPTIEGALRCVGGEPVTILETSTWWGLRQLWAVTRLRSPLEPASGDGWWAADDVLVVRLAGDTAQSWRETVANASRAAGVRPPSGNIGIVAGG